MTVPNDLTECPFEQRQLYTYYRLLNTYDNDIENPVNNILLLYRARLLLFLFFPVNNTVVIIIMVILCGSMLYNGTALYYGRGALPRHIICII